MGKVNWNLFALGLFAILPWVIAQGSNDSCQGGFVGNPFFIAVFGTIGVGVYAPPAESRHDLG
ncbi:MAG: hypothetical protein Q7K34_04115 [archaeon]|nr:hypothetical protein [archaeon]